MIESLYTLTGHVHSRRWTPTGCHRIIIITFDNAHLIDVVLIATGAIGEHARIM
jgi:hypothetical protein